MDKLIEIIDTLENWGSGQNKIEIELNGKKFTIWYSWQKRDNILSLQIIQGVKSKGYIQLDLDEVTLWQLVKTIADILGMLEIIEEGE